MATAPARPSGRQATSSTPLLAGLTVGGVRNDWPTGCATCDGTTWVPDSGPNGVTCPDCDEDGEA